MKTASGKDSHRPLKYKIEIVYRRRRRAPSPTNPQPISSKLPGSGTFSEKFSWNPVIVAVLLVPLVPADVAIFMSLVT